MNSTMDARSVIAFRHVRAWAALTALSLGLSACQTLEGGGGRPAVASQGDNAILSRSEAVELTRVDYRNSLQLLKPEQRAAMSGNRDALREFVLDLHSNVDLARKAERLGLSRDPVTAGQIERARRMILVSALLGHVVDQVEIPENLEELARERYLQQQDKWVTNEARRVAHILITDGANCPCKAPDPLETVATIQRRLGKGEDFAALATEFSQDPGSSANGGELKEWIMRDSKTVPQFENAVFEIRNVGDVSSPIQTRFGLHLIKLLEVEPSRQLTFDEVQPAIEKQITDQLLFSAMEQARGDAYPKLDSIDYEALEELLAEQHESGAGSQVASDAEEVSASIE